MKSDPSAIESWMKKVEGIKSDPPIDYKLVFYDAVNKLAHSNFSLLDIGTGSGKVIFDNELNKTYKNVIGIDIEPGLIEICKNKAKGAKNIEFLATDATKKLPFKDHSFDVVTTMFGPYDTKEVFRVLNDGGWFISLGGLKGDHKEITDLFPEILKLWEGKPDTQTLKERMDILTVGKFKIIANDVMQYKWVFKDEEALREFYKKILFRDMFEGKEMLLSKLQKHIDGGIPITRIIGTTIARKL